MVYGQWIQQQHATVVRNQASTLKNKLQSIEEKYSIKYLVEKKYDYMIDFHNSTISTESTVRVPLDHFSIITKNNFRKQNVYRKF